METRNEILAILKDVKPTKNLENVTDIIEGGYIDSFELLSLISSLNEKFAIEISLDELVPENFNSIEAMVQMVNKLSQVK